MTTQPIDPWNLDSYSRSIHHIFSYYAAKIERGIEVGDEEIIERYAGKLAFLSDKVVAMCKVRALWKVTGLKIEPDRPPAPDPIEQLDDPKLKQKLLARKERLEAKLKVVRAKRRISEIGSEINDEREEIWLNNGQPEEDEDDALAMARRASR